VFRQAEEPMQTHPIPGDGPIRGSAGASWR